MEKFSCVTHVSAMFGMGSEKLQHLNNLKNRNWEYFIYKLESNPTRDYEKEYTIVD